MRMIEAKPDHIDLIVFRPEEERLIEGIPSAIAGMKYMIEEGVCATAIDDGRVIAVFGFSEITPGVYEIWIIPSMFIFNHKIAYLKAARKNVQMLKDTLPWARLQSTSIDDDLHDSWMRFLGFTKGPQVCYDNVIDTYRNWYIEKVEAI